jgi:hypothetical protein
MKEQIITSKDDLEDQLTEVWDIGSGELLESLFHELRSKMKWLIEHEGEYDINPH